MASRYDEHYLGEVSLAENQVAFTWLFNFHCLGGRILDAGCGTGLILEYFQPQPRCYIGFDISLGMLDRARKKFPIYTFLHGDMQDLHRMQSRRCTVYMSLFGSPNYPDNLDAVIKEMKRVLVPGGRYFLMFYSMKYASRESYILREVESEVHFYDEAGIRHAFNANALDPELWGLNEHGDEWGPKLHPEIVADMIKPVKPDDGYFIVAKGIV